MDIEAIKQIQLAQPVNGRLKRRTWIAVSVVLLSITALFLYANHQNKKETQEIQHRQYLSDSLRHAENITIMEMLVENRQIFIKAFKLHDRDFQIDTTEVNKLKQSYEQLLRKE